jgi:hypothetical protein
MVEGTKIILERCSDKSCPNRNPHKINKVGSRLTVPIKQSDESIREALNKSIRDLSEHAKKI